MDAPDEINRNIAFEELRPHLRRGHRRHQARPAFDNDEDTEYMLLRLLSDVATVMGLCRLTVRPKPRCGQTNCGKFRWSSASAT